MVKKREEPKMYVCRTTLMAKSLSDARKQAMKREPDEIWISEDWKEGKNQNLADAIGFDNGIHEEDEE